MGKTRAPILGPGPFLGPDHLLGGAWGLFLNMCSLSILLNCDLGESFGPRTAPGGYQEQICSDFLCDLNDFWMPAGRQGPPKSSRLAPRRPRNHKN